MGIYFTAKNFAYPLAIAKLKKTFDRNEWLSEEQLQDYQLKRLRAILDQAYEHVPCYRNLFRIANLHPQDINSLSDMRAALPFLLKKTIQKQFSTLISHKHARVSSPAREHQRFIRKQHTVLR